MTQCLLRMRTISRSKRTVVVRVSWDRAEYGMKRQQLSARTNKSPSFGVSRHPLPAGEGLLRLFPLFRSRHIECKSKRVDLVVSPELCPGAIASGLGHQTFKGNVRPTAQFLQVCARWDHELRSPAVIIGFRQNVER